MGVSFEKLKERAESLKEANPMLGHRGCRLGISHPEITEMQARAIFEAAGEVAKEGVKVIPEVMIPLVGHVNELKAQREIVDRVAKEVFGQTGKKIKYLVGTMIELPRAAITADQIAQVAEFFSYGTNDLTQTVFGLSRDDAGKFLPFYREAGILDSDPFVSIDRPGVGEVIRIGVEKGRRSQPGAGSGDLRRARRGPQLGRVLPPDRPGLCLLLALPGAHRPAGRGPGGDHLSPEEEIDETKEINLSERRFPQIILPLTLPLSPVAGRGLG